MNYSLLLEFAKLSLGEGRLLLVKLEIRGMFCLGVGHEHEQ